MTDSRPRVIPFTPDPHRGDHLSVAGHPVVEARGQETAMPHLTDGRQRHLRAAGCGPEGTPRAG